MITTFGHLTLLRNANGPRLVIKGQRPGRCTENDDAAVPFYIGTLLVPSLVLVAIPLRGKRKPELLHADRVEVQQWLAQRVSWYNPAVLPFALVVSLFWPGWGTWALLLLILDNVIERLVSKVRGRPAADAG